MDSTKWDSKINFELPALNWMAIHGNLCLGLRHPVNTGPSRTLVEKFVEEIESALVSCGLLDEDDIKLIHETEREETERAQYSS